MARFVQFALRNGVVVWINPDHVTFLLGGRPMKDGTPITHLHFTTFTGTMGPRGAGSIIGDSEVVRGEAATVAAQLAGGEQWTPN